MKIRRSSIWRRLWQSLLPAILLTPAASMVAVAQDRAHSPFIPYKKIAVNFDPYLETGEDDGAGPRPPFAGQVVFAVLGDKLYVTIADSSAGAERAVSPYWLQVNLETGELVKTEQIAEAQAEIQGKTAADNLSLLIAAPGVETLTAQISINEATPASISVPPATSQLSLAFFRGGTLIARDESLRAFRRDSWRKNLLAPGQARGTDYSRGRTGWLRVGKSWVFVFPAEAPRVNTNLYVFAETRPVSPQPAISNADPTRNTRPTSSVTLRPEEKVEALRAAKTIFVRSESGFFTRGAMERELLKRPEFAQWGMSITRQEESADLIIEVHRKRFTTRFTFSAVDPRSGRIMASDTASSIGGEIEPKLAARFINMVKAVRP
ncbi:MAG TPA: hypothetical protein VJ810_13875 [Blastocatellia bacterium]|nr:hypothetical protein [Blastocatellia bacterium]